MAKTKTGAGTIDLATLPRPEQDPRVVALREKMTGLEAEVRRLVADLDDARAAQAQAKATVVGALVGDAGQAEADRAGRQLDEAAAREVVVRRRIELLAQAREAVAATYRAELASAVARARAAWAPHREPLVAAAVAAKAAYAAAEAQLERFDQGMAGLARTPAAERVPVEITGDVPGTNRGEVRGLGAADAARLVAAGQARYTEGWRQALAGRPASPKATEAREGEGGRA